MILGLIVSLFMFVPITAYPLQYCSFSTDPGLLVELYQNDTIIQSEHYIDRPDICLDLPVNDYLNYTNNCHTLESPELYIGIGIGSHLYQQLNSNVLHTLQYLNEYITQCNIIFINQFNFKLTLRHVVISVDESTSWDNVRCISSIYRQYAYWQRFIKINENLSQQLVWHLLDTCYKSNSAIGIATVGTANCNGNAPSITYISSTNPRAFITTAHEIGHNLGAKHHREPGIMGGYAVNKRYKGKIQFHEVSIPEICNGVQNLIQCKNTQNLLKQNHENPGTCGNNIVELKEECDSQSKCCRDCKLTPGSQCDHTNKCCDNCKFKDATSCDLVSHKGYCRNGYCTSIDDPCDEPIYQGCIISCNRKNFTVQNNTLCYTKNKIPGLCYNGECISTQICEFSERPIDDGIEYTKDQVHVHCKQDQYLYIFNVKYAVSSNVIYSGTKVNMKQNTSCEKEIMVKTKTKSNKRIPRDVQNLSTEVLKYTVILKVQDTIVIRNLNKKSNLFLTTKDEL
jgi:hypothetical protein